MKFVYTQLPVDYPLVQSRYRVGKVYMYEKKIFMLLLTYIGIRRCVSLVVYEV